MSLNRYAASRDASEPDIIDAFKAAHWRVVQHKQPYDLSVACGSCGAIYAVEVKTPQDEKKSTPTRSQTHGGRLTKSQLDLILSGWPLHVVYTVDDVRDLIMEHLREANK